MEVDEGEDMLQHLGDVEGLGGALEAGEAAGDGDLEDFGLREGHGGDRPLDVLGFGGGCHVDDFLSLLSASMCSRMVSAVVLVLIIEDFLKVMEAL